MDSLDSLLDTTLDDFTAEADITSPSSVEAAGASDTSDGRPASQRLRDAVARLEAKFGPHADFDLLTKTIAPDVEHLEAVVADRGTATTKPTAKANSDKTKSKPSSSGDSGGSLFQKGFLNNAKTKTSSTRKGKQAATSTPSTKDKGKGKSTDKGIADALEGLKQSTENVASGSAGAAGGAFPGLPPGLPPMPDMNPEELEKMLEAMLKGAGGGGDGEDGANGAGAGVMNSMIEGLFSKSILYPSLTEVNDQYVVFLKEVETKTSASQMKEYQGQHSLVREMIAVYENNAMDSQAQAATVMGLMEKMSSLGPPPEDIMKKLGLEVGPDGMPQGPGGGVPGCPVM
eukprot:m.197773 g.197773  ORF g.197773 m.197773 type:complete len:344 (+) comp20216_c0_seq1:204-1235(+)